MTNVDFVVRHLQSVNASQTYSVNMMNDLINVIEENLGYPGRLIAISKSRYRERYPKSIVYFNACIFDEKGKQIWWGDIDMNKDRRKLNKIAKIYKKSFYVTPEHPFRTDFNNVKLSQLKSDPQVIKFGT